MADPKKTKYRICTRCIMDTSDPEIYFDSMGICNHCQRYDKLLPQRVFKGKEADTKLSALIEQIKLSGANKEYDCIIGVSGGVDSTYVAYLTKQLGLKPLAVHFDNGWNSELAVNNIRKMLDKLRIDLYTHVIDWNSFKNLQISFLKASTPDGEIPTDHAINALLFNIANDKGIKYIINGMNFATESMSVPAWAYGHSDWKYIKSVHKQFMNTSLLDYPHFSILDLFINTAIKRIKVVSILNYIDYNKDDVMELIKNELGWVYYGGKHYESVYTRFYQGYILPVKFNIDKRRGHYSDLIRSGQISRKDAIEEMKANPYDPELLAQDKEFAFKKLGISEDEFDEIMSREVKSFRDYPNNYEIIGRIKKLVNKLRSKGLYSK